MKILWISILVFVFSCRFAPIHATSLHIDSVAMAAKVDSIKQEFPNVHYTGSFPVSFYSALSAYPSLKGVEIKFVSRNISTTMQCRPRLLSVVLAPNKRRFLMVHNLNTGRNKGMPLNKLSFNARIGLYAHEIAHIVDYKNMRAWNIAKLGVEYLSKRGRIAVEHRIDCMVIWVGLGSQIYQYSSEVSGSELISEGYRNRRARCYLKPTEIKELISIVENIFENVNR